LQNEISKIKISLPFNEILKNPEYKGQLSKMIKSEESSNFVNLQDDHPKIMFGPWAQTPDKYEGVPPFYISLRIHGMFSHNAMFDSGASHNLMPKVIMDSLGLDITIPYKDLFSFHSREVKCLGLIKDLVVILYQIPEKSLIMDVVVVDVPPKFGMLLSRSWEAKLKVMLEIDLSYTTILVFGEQRRLYRENHLAYMISDKDNQENHPKYDIDTDMGSTMFYNDICPQEIRLKSSEGKKDERNQQSTEAKQDPERDDLASTPQDTEEGWWHMDFDGAVSKEGAGAGIWVRPLEGQPKLFSYKLSFHCTNNVAEYEALVLGLKVLKDIKATKIHIYGDSELIINQVKGSYQSKHPRLRSYRSSVLDLLENFK
jgi:hypothetical protein